MWLHDWCESVAKDSLFPLFCIAVFVVHANITLCAARESKKGFLPRRVAYAYVATLFSLAFGILCSSVKDPLFTLSPLPDVFGVVIGNLFTFTLPLFTFAWIGKCFYLKSNLARLNCFLLLSYAFLTVISNRV